VRGEAPESVSNYEDFSRAEKKKNNVENFSDPADPLFCEAAPYPYGLLQVGKHGRCTGNKSIPVRPERLHGRNHLVSVRDIQVAIVALLPFF